MLVNVAKIPNKEQPGKDVKRRVNLAFLEDCGFFKVSKIQLFVY